MRLVLALLAGSTCLLAQEWPAIRLHRIASGLVQPTAIEAPPDGSGRLFFLEQPGRVRVMRNGALLPAPFLTLPRVSSGGERGLLGIAFPPGFAAKQYLYLSYTDLQGASVVSRWRVSADNPDRADAGSEEIILRIPRTRSNHNGGNLVFGPDGYLYIGTGDSGGAGDPEDAAQNPNELRGKMLRIDTESGQTPYGIPANPFASRPGYRPEIWAIGLRNPWRYSFDRQTGDLWIADVGQNRAEEINFQPASSPGGENYGWDRMEGFECYSPASGCNRDGLTMPVLEYTRNLGVSVTGGFVYRGSRYPSLTGIYFYADFGSGRIWGYRNAQNRELLDTSFQISTFGQDPDGELYVADHGGGIYLIAAGDPQVSANGVVNAASFGPGLVPGSLATIFGRGITSVPGVVEAQSFPLPVELAGTSVTLSGQRIPIIAVAKVNGQEQVNVQIPPEMAGRATAPLQVNANSASGNVVEVPLTALQPEIFAVTRTGQALTIWATGLGPVTSSPEAGRPALVDPLSRVQADMEVTVDGAAVTVLFAGLAPGFAGLYQVNVLSPGYGEVVLRTGGAVSRPRSSIPATPTAGP